MGGLLGAFVAGWGYGSVSWDKVGWIFLALLISPVIGLVVAFVLTKVTLFFGYAFSFSKKWNRRLNKCQIFSLVLQSLSHGTNDAQKTMGVVTFVLVVVGWYAPSGGVMTVPGWVIVLCASVIALGTFTGGWRIIKTLGWGIYDIKPIHAFASQFSSASIIYGASLMGLPISTTQVISSSIMGAGSGDKPKRVHWVVAKEMGEAWLMTIPASASISACFLFLFKGLWLYALGMAAITAIGYILTHKINIFKLFRETKDFHKMILEQTRVVLDGMKLVEKYCHEPTLENKQAVMDAEERADQARAVVVGNLRNTFVTGPFDRHNLENLAQKLDDILDEAAKKAVARMAKLEVPTDEILQKMAGKIVGAVELLKTAIEALTIDPQKCRESINAARKKENAVQHLYEDWLGQEDSNLDSLNSLAKLRKYLKELLKKQTVQFSFMKAAEKVVEATEEVEIILAKIS